jgi:hypothetical protein
MFLVPKIFRMLANSRKLWMAPLFLVSIVLGRVTMKNTPVEREAFIYTLF